MKQHETKPHENTDYRKYLVIKIMSHNVYNVNTVTV